MLKIHSNTKITNEYPNGANIRCSPTINNICKKYNTYKNTMKSASSFSQIFANTQTHNMITIPLRLQFAAKIIISYLNESCYNLNNIYMYIPNILHMRLYIILFCDSFLYKVITHKMMYITVFTYYMNVHCMLYYDMYFIYYSI